MSELPEKFPEYSIMYKTLSKKISELKKREEITKGGERDEIKTKIQNYQIELVRIKRMFPDNFFD